MSLPLVVTPGMTFDEASEAVLLYLREHVPMGYWAVTRVENGRQSYLYLGDNVYGLQRGDSHPWEDSFCIHMVAGTAPRVAPRAQEIALYRDAGVNAGAEIGAYAGAPIWEPDGSTFGAICGLDVSPHGDELLTAEPLLGLLSSLLSMTLAAERANQRAAEVAASAVVDAETDVLTGLLNRRGWDRVIAETEERFARLADPTVVVMVDLDRLKEINDGRGHAAGDRYIADAGSALRRVLRHGDTLARLGGDEFAMVLPGCPETTGPDKVDQIYRALLDAGVAGSVGWAPISIVRGFPAALHEADAAMYSAKALRRALRAETAGDAPAA